tara:strand:+ start:5218 stop:5793 length:576 start_codon:yes stop_codon:yes gene_type:complete
MPELAERLERLAQDKECVTVDQLVRTIGAQGHAPLLMIAAIFLILPVGMIPGVGGVLGTLVAVIGFHMLLGNRKIALPRFMRDRELPADRICHAAQRVRPALHWLRRHLHVRMEYLSGSRVSLTIIALLLMASGASMLVLGALPIAAPIMGLPIAVFAFGILARDGAVVLAGYLMVIAAFAALIYLRTLIG